MGQRNPCCRCPEGWEEFVDEWVYIFLVNDSDAFLESAWLVREVHDRYIVLRRRMQDGCGWQEIAVSCQYIVAIVEAPRR